MKPLRLDIDDAVFDSRTGHRAPASLHGTASAVDIAAADLGEIRQWPFVLDEAFRLLREQGHLRFRITESLVAEKHMVAKTIASLSLTPPRLITVEREGPTQTLKLLVTRRPVDTNISGFTFGVVSDGRNLDRLQTLLSTIRQLQRPVGTRTETLVCGPEQVLKHADLGPDVAIIAEDVTFASSPWITGKKNRLIEAASYPNLILTHDRYRFPHDFLIQLVEWGGDYSFLVCAARSPDGSRFPDWIALGGDTSTISYPIALLDYADYHTGVYANGGLIIAKRDTLRANPLSEMLWWGEAEDIELSHRLRDAGHLLRLAPHVVVESIETTAGYVSAVVPVRQAPSARPTWSTRRSIEETSGTCAQFAPHTIAGLPADLTNRSASVRSVGDSVEVVVGTTVGSWSSFHIAISTLERPLSPSVIVGEAKAEHTERWCEWSQTLTLSFRVCPSSPITTIAIRPRTENTMVSSVSEVVETALPEQRGIVLGHGWWPVESWGAWARSNTAHVLCQASTLEEHYMTLVTPPIHADAMDVSIYLDGVPSITTRIPKVPSRIALESVAPTVVDNVWHLVTIRSDPARLLQRGGYSDERRLGIGILLPDSHEP